MFDLKSLYKEVILDHNRRPRNFGKLEQSTMQIEGFNPLCGDQLTLYLDIGSDQQITGISFEGSGCAISIASASLMTDFVKGKSVAEAASISHVFHDFITTDGQADIDDLGKLAALGGVKAYPARVKCATLCWHSLQSILKGDNTIASTE